MSNGKREWLDWFMDEYTEPSTGLYPYSENAMNDTLDMSFARNKILCGIADALERIATQLEKPLEKGTAAEEWMKKEK